MIGKTISRIASILVGTVFMMGMIPTGVWAAGEPAGGAVSAGIIDTGMTGSITVHKTDAESGEGIPGAVFIIAQVGAITTVSATEGTGTYVTDLDGTLQSIFEGCGAMPEPAGDGAFRIDEIAAACDAANRGAWKELLALASGKTSASGTTGQDGTFTAGSLVPGVYLVSETKTPDGYLPGNSFLVMLPVTNTEEVTAGGRSFPAGTAWVYDIDVNPKNVSPEIEKYIVADDGEALTKSGDYSIGDEVRKVIIADAPLLADGYTSYEITDEMDDTLVYKEVFGVYIGRKMGGDAKLSDIEALKQVKAGAYSVKASEDGHSFKVSFGKNAIAALNALKEDSACYLVFGTEITETAQAGSAMTNEPWYEIGNHTGKHKFTGNKTEEYTYGLRIEKSGVSDFSKVSFTLEKNGKTLTFRKDNAGYYFPSVLENAGESLVPDADGRILIKGLDAGKYQIRENSTEPGRNLLTGPLTVQLTAKAPLTGALQKASVSAGGDAKSLKVVSAGKGMAKAVAVLPVNNTTSLTLHTGGAGYLAYGVLAAVFFGAALMVLNGAGRKSGRKR
ncbi:MAG: SpaH/EbpB family LPXTG-anchored major pilin [Lachnospiraceae bacterium]|nr:SpaH/EbpB family LPXTG-anchored major pilin [Lachnospiraceae bacterium]